MSAFLSNLADNAGTDWAALRCILVALAAWAVVCIGASVARRARK